VCIQTHLCVAKDFQNFKMQETCDVLLANEKTKTKSTNWNAKREEWNLKECKGKDFGLWNVVLIDGKNNLKMLLGPSWPLMTNHDVPL
jgi:hypothetical protein